MLRELQYFVSISSNFGFITIIRHRMPYSILFAEIGSNVRSEHILRLQNKILMKFIYTIAKVMDFLLLEVSKSQNKNIVQKKRRF